MRNHSWSPLGSPLINLRRCVNSEPANDFLRVEPDATSLANALTSGAAAQFAAKLPAEPGHGAVQSVVDAAQAESLWAPSIAAGTAIRADALAAGAALAATPLRSPSRTNRP